MKRQMLILALVIFGATLGALIVWSVAGAQIVGDKLKSATSTNPLLALLTGGR
jgi:hypothetical protein